MAQFTPLLILFDILAIVSLLTGFLTSSLILFIITCKLTSRRTIVNLLLGNTCLCTLELCLSNLIIYGFIIVNDATSTTSLPSLYDQRHLCPIRSYFLFAGFSLLYTSYCLQAYYRFRQVVYYNKHSSYRTFVCLCVIQWIFAFLLVLPMLLTQSFVYIPTEFFCPIPFTKPLSVLYVAVSVYGVFLIIFVTFYLWIYKYTTRTTLITAQRRQNINRQFTMLKRMIFPTFSLMFLGIVYLTLFFQTIANQYQTNFLTYRLSYMFIAIGMSFIHIITISQTPSIRNALWQLFYSLTRQIWRREENLNNWAYNQNMTIQQQYGREEQMTITTIRRNKIGPTTGINTFKLTPMNHTEK